MAELAGHARRPAHDLTAVDDATAETCTDDRRHGRAVLGLGAEEVLMGVQRRGIAVVVVEDRQAEVGLGRGADVVVAPRRLLEVRRSLRRDDARGAGRTRGVEADGENCGVRYASGFEGDLHRTRNGFESGIGTLVDAARNLGHVVDEKSASHVEHGAVGLRSADVDSDDDDDATRFGHARSPPARRTPSGVRQFVRLDAGDDRGVIAMVQHDVLFDLVVVAEDEVAIRALSVLVHYDKLSRVRLRSSSIVLRTGAQADGARSVELRGFVKRHFDESVDVRFQGPSTD